MSHIAWADHSHPPLASELLYTSSRPGQANQTCTSEELTRGFQGTWGAGSGSMCVVHIFDSWELGPMCCMGPTFGSKKCIKNKMTRKRRINGKRKINGWSVLISTVEIDYLILRFNWFYSKLKLLKLNYI